VGAMANSGPSHPRHSGYHGGYGYRGGGYGTAAAATAIGAATRIARRDMAAASAGL
jgi:hypothetical protein